MPGEREWLRAEQSGQEALAETVFARLIADMPVIEPGAAFVDRTARAAWRVHRRRRMVTRLARVTAVLALGFVTAGSLYELSILAAGLVAGGAVALSRAFVWLLTSAREGAHWWWIADRIGAAVGNLIASPLTAAAVAAVETTVLLAMFAFRQLLQKEQ